MFPLGPRTPRPTFLRNLCSPVCYIKYRYTAQHPLAQNLRRGRGGSCWVPWLQRGSEVVIMCCDTGICQGWSRHRGGQGNFDPGFDTCVGVCPGQRGGQEHPKAACKSFVIQLQEACPQMCASLQGVFKKIFLLQKFLRKKDLISHLEICLGLFFLTCTTAS